MDAKETDLTATDGRLEWKGYDLDQLRYRRAYVLARSEIERIRLMSRYESLRSGLPSIKTSGVASRMLKGLSYMDYAFLAYKAVTKAMKLFGRRRHRK